MDYTYDTRMGYSEKAYKKAGLMAILMMGGGAIGMLWGGIFTLFGGIGLIVLIPSFMLFKKGWKQFKVCSFIYDVARISDPNVNEDNIVQYLGISEEKLTEYATIARKLQIIE